MRLLAAEANEKGDLFGRLIADLFHTLGYTDPRLTVSKTGREIDISARHRLEPKRAVGECKACAEPVGGSDLNKFAGVLQLESEDSKSEAVQGYFVSLNGFTESALAQERELSEPRFVLLTGDHVEAQLVQGATVVSPEAACDASGRLVPTQGDLVPEGAPQLLAHDLGWLWLCQYGEDHEVTHFTLIHADGRPLASALAQKVIEADAEVGGVLHGLTYLAPQNRRSQSHRLEVSQHYRHYLLTELAQITLEGLPVDEEAGARRIALEDLYIPLRLKPAPPKPRADKRSAGTEEDTDSGADAKAVYHDVKSVGEILSRESRLAILASPGTGKSTLIKRLAVAYASKEHRMKVTDDLPDTDWLPLFIRCRSLNADAHQPIRKILAQIPDHGEFPEFKEAFDDLVTSSLRGGKVLLLIDGLDEIADSRDRIGFVLQLRTFLSTYPNVALVITSREAGFRIVAGAISTVCQWYQLDEFSDDDIVSLTRAWHTTVVGKSEKVESEAQGLATTIVSTDRVKRLARNPLLLTTLLLVKRWVGDLPRKRAVLYGKAIEVLLMTWNVEAHEPIESEEAIPQLAFVAHSLTERGVQRVNASDLSNLLKEARTQMPEILGFARISVKQFIDRIESRSSLLVMTGHEEEQGKLVPVYEFRHLTFQEYLAAVALVEGYYPEHSGGDRLADRLERHFMDAQWFEVVALANVLSGRTAREVISRLLEVARSKEDERLEPSLVIGLLGRSLADEVQMPPELVEETARRFARGGKVTDVYSTLIWEILEGRYGTAFFKAIQEGYVSEDDDFPRFADVYSVIARRKYGATSLANEVGVKLATSDLTGEDELVVSNAALWIMNAVYEDRVIFRDKGQHPLWGTLEQWSRDLIGWCEEGRPYVAHSATWGLAWLGDIGAVASDDRPAGLRALLSLWRRDWPDTAQRQAAWAFSKMPPVERKSRPLGSADRGLREFVERQAKTKPAPPRLREDRRPAAAILAYYLEEPWSDEEIERFVGRISAAGSIPRNSLPEIRRALKTQSLG